MSYYEFNTREIIITFEPVVGRWPCKERLIPRTVHDKMVRRHGDQVRFLETIQLWKRLK